MQEYLYIDTENFSELDLTQVGVYKQVEHESTECIIFTAAYRNEVWVVDLYDEPYIPQRLIDLAGSDEILVVAHNAEYDRTILEGRPGRRIGWPSVPLKRWVDTQAIAAALAIPLKLELGIEAVGSGEPKDPRGQRLIHKFCKPRTRLSKADKSPRWGPWNAKSDWEEFLEYGRQDVVSLAEYHKTLLGIRPLPDDEWRVWRFTVHMHERGVPVDVPNITKAIRLTRDYSQTLHAETQDLTGGLRTTQRDKIIEWFSLHDVNLPNLQAETVKGALADAKYPARRVLEIRQELGKVSTKKLDKMRMCACSDGRVRGTLQYHGAAPGRYAGRMIQPQNYPRGNLKPEQIEEVIAAIEAEDIEALLELGAPMDLVSSSLRAMICAPKGYRIYAGDYSSIEARGVCWLAGEDAVLKEYQQGIDAYVAMASVIFHKPMDTITSGERKLGKDTVLGCGYQMWADTFRQQLIDRGGEDVGEELALQCVKAYRRKHKKVKKLWYNMEAIAIRAIDYPRRWFDVPHTHGRLKFCYAKDFLWMKLPSGRLLSYPYAHVEMTKRHGKNKRQIRFMGIGKNYKWIELSTYGGKLTENATQATARDLMVHGMLNVQRHGYDVFTTVHDEVVTLADPDRDVNEFERLLCDLPEWAKGFPLAAGAYRARRYRKD